MTQKVDCVIVGVGLNVNGIDFPEDLEATSLRIETGMEHERDGLLDGILEAMDAWVGRYLSGGVAALTAAFADNDFMADRNVSARVGGKILCGRALGLADDGSLRLLDGEGVEHRVIAGDVEVVPDMPADMPAADMPEGATR